LNRCILRSLRCVGWLPKPGGRKPKFFRKDSPPISARTLLEEHGRIKKAVPKFESDDELDAECVEITEPRGVRFGGVAQKIHLTPVRAAGGVS
jgi:hypothetical protein